MKTYSLMCAAHVEVITKIRYVNTRKLGHGFDDDDVATHVSDFLNEPSPIKKKLLWSYN